MSVLPGPRGASALWSLLPFCLFVAADALYVIDLDAPELTWSQGFIHCNLESESQFPAVLPDPSSSLDVTEMELKATLCRSDKHDYKPCLLIDLTLQEEDVLKDMSEESGDDIEDKVMVKVSLSSSTASVWKAIQCTPAQPTSNQSSTPSPLKLLLKEQVDFGIVVVVVAYSKNMHIEQNITIPPLEEVCSMILSENITACDVPRIVVVFERDRDLILLQLTNPDSEKEAQLRMLWNEMPKNVLLWPQGKREMTITSEYIAPCLCFEVWWKDKGLRRKYCPFTSDREAVERMLPHVSLTVVESQVRDRGTALTWNVTSPCALEADLWLCTKDFEGGHCKELTGSRQKLGGVWTAGHGAHWQTGEFNVSSHPLTCVQIKGMESNFEPQCPYSNSRVRWILPLLIGFPLMCIAILGAYIAQGILKGYVWKWLKEDDVKGAVGGGHVVLLYPPDENEQALPGLLCQLGSSLQDLGFTVSLDLWSQTELSILGPVPWLHSRLDRLQRQGGKVVLVLTQVTWTRAEEWGALSCSRSTPTENNRNKENPEGSSPTSSHRADVFGASLSCILADCLQGRAGERFMLVQFESLPPEPPGSFRPLPQLFRGLHVYSLPSQSLGFLTELAGAQRAASASTRRKRAGGLRIASRALAQKLSGFTAGTNVLQVPLLPQGCVGGQDLGETVPLNSCLITDECSPDTNPVVRETEWA
ncbi:uncharacterized protein wu:fl23c11 [Oryzias melastigma]|uniref:Uncharacterized LOC112158625 n=1 Tax=Oryzias melastigma TaxID=30732 RepID=A0A3B3DA18_ORYME|nr:uncharacterized protein wu:fl23c11 [Oryzias melastigma]